LKGFFYNQAGSTWQITKFANKPQTNAGAILLMKNNRLVHTGLFALSALMITFVLIIPQNAGAA
jgi:hypothetical protein